ncbi:ATP-binding protein [Spirillospora sp. NPDC047418]
MRVSACTSLLTLITRYAQTPHGAGYGFGLTTFIAGLVDEGAGGARPVMRDAADGESGRGLHIVAALAERWGHRADGARTTVWADFPARVRSPHG